MRKLSIVFLLFVICFTGEPIKGQFDLEKNLSREIGVSVSVSCDDQITKSQIEGFLKRELRSLGDVEIIADNPIRGYWLLLTVLEPECAATGNKTGNIVISSIFIKNDSLFEILGYYDLLSLENNFMDIVRNKDAYPMVYRHHITNYLIYDKTENLSNICEGIVANFDTNALEVERQRK